MKKLLAPLVLASALAGCTDRTPQVITMPAQTQAASPGVMTVSGSATLDISPDCADMTMTMTADGARPGAAATAIGKKQTALLDAMKALGIATSDMKISHVQLNPIYRAYPHELKAATYRAELTITVTTKKFDLIAEMMEHAANAGASQLSTQFRRSDLPELKKKVREMALKAAKEKAQLTAKTLGITIGRVTSVAEMPAGHMWQAQYFPNYVANNVDTVAAPNAQALGGVSQTLSLDISIGYELSTKT